MLTLQDNLCRAESLRSVRELNYTRNGKFQEIFDQKNLSSMRVQDS